MRNDQAMKGESVTTATETNRTKDATSAATERGMGELEPAKVLKLVLTNDDGQVIRAFRWAQHDDAGEAVVIRRSDTRRIEIHTGTQQLEAERIPFEALARLERKTLEVAPVTISGVGRVSLVNDVEGTIRDADRPKENDRFWYASLALVAALTVGFVAFIESRPATMADFEAELKQQVVQIVKRIPPKPKPVVVPNQRRQAQVSEVVPTTKTTMKTASIKRLGALAVLGSLNQGKQKGGIDLGAVNTTAGPGLGGTGGSGGVQQSLYGKGLVAAPVGAGGNLQGGGGYGTKGRGGGQAGYGKLSLVGSAGTMPIPLGREALIQGGLDGDQINDVITKNMGQIRFCYEQGLQSEPGLAGRVAVDFTINGNGQVTIASVGNTTLNSKIVEDCILMRLRSWKFPLPEGGVDVKVSYPFMLRRSGQG